MRLLSIIIFAALIFAGSAAPAQPPQTITFEYYPVRPEAGRSVYSQMFEDSPLIHSGRKVAALTDWNIRKVREHLSLNPAEQFEHHHSPGGPLPLRGYDCEYQPSDAEICAIAAYEIVSVCKITLPELITDEKKLHDAFSEYIPRLRNHELHHCQIAADYADDLEERLKALKSQGATDCRVLKSAVKSARNSVVIEAKKAHRLFDRQTLENRKNFHAGQHFLGDLFPGPGGAMLRRGSGDAQTARPGPNFNAPPP